MYQWKNNYKKIQLLPRRGITSYSGPHALPYLLKQLPPHIHDETMRVETFIGVAVHHRGIQVTPDTKFVQKVSYIINYLSIYLSAKIHALCLISL